ncbi:MAG: hypothetical protein GX444_15495 [Myxococcales bacterium]|nr:hypothetical protein [Myxococcales bacterium]
MKRAVCLAWLAALLCLAGCAGSWFGDDHHSSRSAGATDERPAGDPAAVSVADDDDDDDDASPLFPKSPEPHHLIVIDGLNLTDAERLLFVSLQGVLAQTEPRLYFDPSPLPYNDGTHEEEGRWLTEMQTKWGVTSETAADPWAVFDGFLGDVSGYVVYDPDLPQTVNVATTLAGLRQAVIAHPDLIPALEGRGLPLVEDLRGRFADHVELYTWAFAELWLDCNHEIMAFLQDGLMPLRDYLIAQRVFTLQLDPHHYAERPLLEEILAATPRDIPILGWPLDELLGVILFSQYGKYLVAADYTPNLSAHSGLPPLPITQEHVVDWPEVENRIHVAFAYTDGDSLAYANRWMPDWFDDPAYGELPIGWELSCSLYDLAPDVLGFYYDRMDENDFVLGPVSGVGYIYPNRYPDLDPFLAKSKTCLDRAAMRTLWLLNDDLTLSDDLANRYGAALDLLGIYMDYWPTADKGWYFSTNGTPVVHSQYTYLVGPEQIGDILAEAAIAKEYFYPDVPTFVFIGVNGWVTSPTYIQSFVAGLDDRYRVVRPDALFAAMRAARERGWAR